MQGETADRILQTARTLISDLVTRHSATPISPKQSRFGRPVFIITSRRKPSLVVAVLKNHRERLLQGTEFLTQKIDDPLARLHAYVQHWEGCIRDKSQPFCIAALLAAELPSLPEEVRVEVQKHFLALCEWIRETLQEGVRKRTLKLQGTPEDEAQTFMATVHGAMLSARASEAAMYFRQLPPAHYNESPCVSPSQQSLSDFRSLIQPTN